MFKELGFQGFIRGFHMGFGLLFGGPLNPKTYK